jgi:hypothetical protein
MSEFIRETFIVPQLATMSGVVPGQVLAEVDIRIQKIGGDHRELVDMVFVDFWIAITRWRLFTEEEYSIYTRCSYDMVSRWVGGLCLPAKLKRRQYLEMALELAKARLS